MKRYPSSNILSPSLRRSLIRVTNQAFFAVPPVTSFSIMFHVPTIIKINQDQSRSIKINQDQSKSIKINQDQSVFHEFQTFLPCIGVDRWPAGTSRPSNCPGWRSRSLVPWSQCRSVSIKSSSIWGPNTWGFPEIGVPHDTRGFSMINHPFGIVPIYGNPLRGFFTLNVNVKFLCSLAEGLIEFSHSACQVDDHRREAWVSTLGFI